MTSKLTRRITIHKKVLHILIPDVITDPSVVRNVSELATHNSEKEEYILELCSLAKELDFGPVIHRLAMDTIVKIIDTLPADELILNLCDGCDVDGVPGPSVAKYCEDKKLRGVVGCDSLFINNTLTKNGMKEIFRANLVSTPPGFAMTRATDLAFEVENYGMVYPLFVKVSDSYGSVGLDDDSVCHDYNQLKSKCDKLLAEFENLTVEEYIDGQEFSVLVSGNCRDENQQVIVYPPAERAFNADVEHYKRFISFQRNWDDAALVHKYAAPQDPNDVIALQDLARRAYISVSGNCYGRVDIRKRDVNVNASCGLGKGSSSEFILVLAGQTTQDFFKIILAEALKPADEEFRMSDEPIDMGSEEIKEAVDQVASLNLNLLPKSVEDKVAELISHPSLAVIPRPVVNVIVSAVLVDAESGIADPEGKINNPWGKDGAYVSELETLFRTIGLDPIVHLYHVDDLTSALSGLSTTDDLIFNACLGGDGLEVARLLDSLEFKRVVGLNAEFFESSRVRSMMNQSLRSNRLATPDWIVASSQISRDAISKLLTASGVEFPVYIKPAIAHSRMDGDHGGAQASSLDSLCDFISSRSTGSEDWIVQTFVRGSCYRVLVAGDARDPNADVIVFPPVLENHTFVSTSSLNNPELTRGGRPSVQRIHSFLSKEELRIRASSSAVKYASMPSSQLILQMDLQDLARRSFVAVHGSCYGLVNIIDTGSSLVVVSVSGDVRFGEDAKAGTVLSLAGLGAEDLFRWLVKHVDPFKL